MAFEGLTEKLNAAFKRLRGKGRLTENDVREAMREVRLALLEADVSYKVVKDFVASVTERAVGSDVPDSLTPAQQVVKIVNEELTSRMGFRSMPFVFRDLEQIQRLYANPEGEIYKLYSSYAEELGIHVLGFGVGNFRGLANRKHRVTVPGDLSDITMRIYEDQTVKNFLSPLCNATIIPFNEAYTAIQTGTCDGIEVGAPVINYAKFYEVCGYYTDINWQATSYGFHMSDNCWNMLPEDLRQIVIDCSWEASAAEYDQQVADTEAAYAALEELGVEVYHLTAEERQAWMDYADTLADFFRDYVGAETYDTVKEIVAADSAAHPAA